jgi:hypothetical protein
MPAQQRDLLGQHPTVDWVKQQLFKAISSSREQPSMLLWSKLVSEAAVGCLRGPESKLQ